jgi:hypothetical protein
MPLKRQRFADILDIQRTITLLWGTAENNFQDCFRKWHHHLSKSIASQGEYSEGMHYMVILLQYNGYKQQTNKQTNSVV